MGPKSSHISESTPISPAYISARYVMDHWLPLRRPSRPIEIEPETNAGAGRLNAARWVARQSSVPPPRAAHSRFRSQRPALAGEPLAEGGGLLWQARRVWLAKDQTRRARRKRVARGQSSSTAETFAHSLHVDLFAIRKRSREVARCCLSHPLGRSLSDSPEPSARHSKCTCSASLAAEPLVESAQVAGAGVGPGRCSE